MDVSFCYSPEDCTRSTVCLTVSCFWSSASADQYMCSGIVHRCAGWLLIIKWTIFQCAHCDEVNTVGFIASMPVYLLLWHWDFALRPVALDSLYQGILHMPSLKRCKWCNFNWFSFNYTSVTSQTCSTPRKHWRVWNFLLMTYFLLIKQNKAPCLWVVQLAGEICSHISVFSNDPNLLELISECGICK